jgi:ABC-type branched-subunit amino acid transport system permease subunit
MHQATWLIWQDGGEKNMNYTLAKPHRNVMWIALIWFVLISLVLHRVNEYQILILGTVAISAIVGVGLNVLMGLSGQISLGHAAFYAIGAYTASILAATYQWSYALATLMAIVVSGVVGVLLSLPGLRLRGPYLAMVTIAFGYFVEQGIANWKDVTGGWNGLMGIPQPSWIAGGAFSPKDIAWVATLLSALLVIAYSFFSASRWGRMMRASKDSEIASESLGIQIVWIRVLAFSISTAITGLGGSLFATLNGFISPESFPFFQSIIFSIYENSKYIIKRRTINTANMFFWDMH